MLRKRITLTSDISEDARALCNLRNALTDILSRNAGEPSTSPDERWNVHMAISDAILARTMQLEKDIAAARATTR